MSKCQSCHLPKAFPMFHRAEKNDYWEGTVSTKNVVSTPNFETKAGGSNDLWVEKKLLAPKNWERNDPKISRSRCLNWVFSQIILKNLKITSSHRAFAWHSQNKSHGSKKKTKLHRNQGPQKQPEEERSRMGRGYTCSIFS